MGQIPEETGEDFQAVSRPTSAGRIVRHFDFEERGFNAFDVPLYWIRAQDDPEVRRRPGFPISNLGRLDYGSPASSGGGSVRLDTSGGSTSLRLLPNVVTIFPSVEYAVGAMIRAEGLDHARPRLVARLLDADGQPIENAEASTVVERGPDGWPGHFTPVLLKLPPAPDDAVSIQIDIELVQPEAAGEVRDPPFDLWEEDYAGTVWFDDVLVVQVPTGTLRTNNTDNIFVASEQPELLATVRDLSGDPIDIRLEVFDVNGDLVAIREQRFGMGFREIRWQPPLPRLGWYEASLVVSVEDTPMISLQERFVWLADSTPGMEVAPMREGLAPSPRLSVELSDRRRLGLVLPEAMDRVAVDSISGILERSGARSFFAPVDLPDELDVAGAATGERIDGWTDLARQVTGLFSRLGVEATIVLQAEDDPQEDAVRSRGDRSFSVLGENELWDGFLVAMIDRLADGVSRWHFGPLGADTLAATPRAVETLGSIAGRLHRLAPDPRVGVPWAGAFDPSMAVLPRPTRRWGLTVQAPMHADASWISEVAGRLRDMVGEETIDEATILIQPLDAERFGRRAGIGHLADQMLAFWEALPSASLAGEQDVPVAPLRLALSGGWHWNEDGSPPDMQPVLAAWRGIGDRLAGKRHIYTFENLDGIIASVYEPVYPSTSETDGLLVLRTKPGSQISYYEQYLGEAPVRVYDVFGNGTDVAFSELAQPHTQTPRHAHRIPLGQDPVFVEGVDTNLLMFIASIRLEPDLLEAIDVEHRAALVFRNPWPGATSVRSRVVSPGGFGGLPVAERSWEISPRLSDLLIEAGREERTPINIRFRRSEPAGRKQLGLDLDIRGENSTRRLHVEVPFRIGLDYLDVLATARRTSDGVLVLVEVRNLGDRAVTLEATAIARAAGRRRAVIPQLTPGATARREILLRGADIAEADQIVLSVEDIDVGARLNYQVDVP